MGRRTNWDSVFFKKTPEHHKMLAVAFFLAALAALGVFTAPSPSGDLCSSYSGVSGTSCRDAIKVALKAYPGYVDFVQSDFSRTFPSLSGQPPKLEWDGWLVRVALDTPIDSGNVVYYEADVVVDKQGYAVSQFVGW
ncbi:MAG: hypothetical protein HY365_00505 [Candidatus Aenigmarchaeota archaeon]|nr:hypothetical protein [Candidatus Aenigmarchaeota archaeon]